MTGNIHEDRARLRRAWKLADVLQHAGTAATEAETLAEEHWQMAAEVAGITPPSSDTRQLTIELLQLREADTDPFDGLPS